ncbi:B3 domain-containing protein [Sesamum angolense]|uniref:B3 domain-containing protein n=1 Tax=Sesamum angolense TaxID=2727404 RepID=A0AAE1X9V2_9LAMI|nr:B3 domain-containing protein [Sesamum angolense]
MDRFSGAGRHPKAWSQERGLGGGTFSLLLVHKEIDRTKIVNSRSKSLSNITCVYLLSQKLSDSKKRKISDNKVPREGEPSGLDALATAAVLGDNISDIAESSVGATTRHPRHRPGCTCIVCIQPPSGKGKHEPMCKCNVCLTVRRRFKTLMMRKKKRQSEREAELAQGKDKASVKVGLEREDIAGHALLNMSHHTDNETNQNGNQTDLEETNKGQLDLNCDPHREDDILAEAAGMSLTTLMNAATLPLDMYLGQNGVPVTGPCLISRTAGESEENAADEGFTSGRVDQENNREDG